ncbi:Hypothetical protein PHPALM_19440 [Phytophthora palmivora]|uniref:Tc3 transposase DNA binding domain-containing protein n=1 Tax=Phytophthora palmivora TaxID=4796 RepID=A0A2P4XHD3_9STRA|nr:Hypothetical protein PHPALM_19440 [Phytophthora palmivora]
MCRGNTLTDQEHWWIIGLHDGGVSLHEIARKTGRSRTSVRKAIKAERGPASDSGDSDTRAGQQPVLTEWEVRLLIRTAAAGDQFVAELKAKLGLKASVRTIQRVLQRVDHLVYTKMDCTLPLTAAHKAARMEWAEVHIFNPDGPDGFKFYWQDMRRPPRSYLQRQYGGGSVMVWGAFSAVGKSKLVFLKGRQSSGDYIYTISGYMLPFAHSLRTLTMAQTSYSSKIMCRFMYHEKRHIS